MGASVSWLIEGRGRAGCFVYTDRPPMVDLSDRAGFSLTISSGAGDAASVEAAAFARELAVAVQRYARECARWVGTDVVGGSGSARSALRIPEEALTAAGGAFLAALERATAATPTGDPRHAYADEVVAAAVEAAAPVVVAWELRRLVTEVGGDAGRYGWVWALGARADELDPDGSGDAP